MLVCVEPRWIRPAEPGLIEVRMVGTRLRDPLDDTQFIVHGWPYVPPTYEQFRCLAENGPPPEPGMGAGVPTPEEALAMALNHPAVEPVLAIAAREHDVVPFMFHYGPLAGTPPQAPIAYDLDGDRSRGFLYVLVRRASHRQLEVQLGYNRSRGDLRRTYVEDGMRLEWQSEGGGWDGGAVIERWEAPPPFDGR
jgi:hypothetical protein